MGTVAAAVAMRGRTLIRAERDGHHDDRSFATTSLDAPARLRPPTACLLREALRRPMADCVSKRSQFDVKIKEQPARSDFPRTTTAPPPCCLQKRTDSDAIPKAVPTQLFGFVVAPPAVFLATLWMLYDQGEVFYNRRVWY